MACTSISLNGINSSCDASMGGILEVFLAPYAEISGVTADSAGTVTGVTMNDSGITFEASGTTGPGWASFKFRKNTSSLTKTLNKDDANGVEFYENDLTMLFSKMEASKRTELVALAKGGVIAVVKDANGIYWLLGLDEEVVVNELSGQTGTAKTDGNYYQVVLRDSSKELPNEISKALGDAVALAASQNAA